MDMARRIAAAMTLAASVVLALPGLASAATRIGVEDDFFSPKRTTFTVGDSDVEWLWDLDGSSAGVTENPHDVVSSDDLFDSGELMSSGTYMRRASAGTFGYFCSIHDGMTGRLGVTPEVKATAGKVRLRWAEGESNTGDRFDVRFRVRPGARWRSLLEDSRIRKTTFSTERGRAGKVAFQARSQRGKGSRRQSEWSPTVEAAPVAAP